ncbi:hypothetical protein HMPREF1986_01094 [Oribacterium sp. oral taxon 078 str. F0263]|nr:hypothetical protein HMPREF1986_01094 [Oribacterium sp. oral taxon 078 str. F0263]
MLARRSRRDFKTRPGMSTKGCEAERECECRGSMLRAPKTRKHAGNHCKSREAGGVGETLRHAPT